VRNSQPVSLHRYLPPDLA